MSDAAGQLEHLYRDLAPALLAYFRRQPTLGRLAEDLVQDTFVRAIRGVNRLQSSASPRAYLFGIARHVSIDALRQHRPTEELVDEPPAETPPPVDERLFVLQNAIAALPGPQRETLVLKLQHELSYEDIAEVLGIPIGTVRSRIHHAVAHLRAALNPPRPPALAPTPPSPP
jgi:RNA polymerase sigma-70 factor (ECF subfamily)